MKSRVLSIALILLGALLSGKVASAQNITAYDSFSPFTMFGLGHIDRVGDQNSLAMGGVGIGNRDVTVINLQNPAAVTARENQAFMLDFGLQQRNVYAMKDNERSANNMFNIHHIVASFPIYKSSAFKVGVMPYSSVGYKFSHHEDDDQIIASIGDILYQQSGQGSLYQVFAGAGVTFFKRLSVGGDAIFYIGSIDRYSNVDFTTNTYYRSYIRGWEYVPRGWSGKFGLQYEQPIGKDLSLTLGVTYKLASQLKGYATSYTYAESTSYTDTLASYLDLPAAYSIPSEKGIGLSLKKNEKWMVEFDYLRQDWKKTIFDPTPGIDFATGNSETFNLGFEIIPNKYDIRYFMKRVTYRVGAYHSKTYMMINGQQLCNTGITLGFSVPVFNRNTSIAFSVDLGQYGPFDKASMKERYFKFNLGLNLFDTWFHKSLYN